MFHLDSHVLSEKFLLRCLGSFSRVFVLRFSSILLKQSFISNFFSTLLNVLLFVLPTKVL